MGLSKKILISIIFLIFIIWCYLGIEENFDNIENISNIKKHTYGDFEILEIYNLLTPDECKKLIELAKNQGLEDSKLTYNYENNNVNDKKSRKSQQAFLEDNCDSVVMKFAQSSEQITGIPIKNQEKTQIVVYQPGGFFIDHYDAFCIDNTSKEDCDKLNNNAGDRRATLLVYLNDNFEGGETEFVELGLKIKPETGKGILFWSTNENGDLLLKSKHKGSVLLSGEKWIATKWSHPKEYK